MSDAEIHSLPMTAGGVTTWHNYVASTAYDALKRQLADLQTEVQHYRDAAASVGESDGHGWAETTKALQRQLQQREEEQYVPGSWSCAHCPFSIVTSNLYVLSGTIGPNTDDVPICPNDGNLMQRVTWKEYATEAQKVNERLAEKSDAEMLRAKACEHIAEGEEGWEALRNECPSTAAVATLRDDYQAQRARLDVLEGALKLLAERYSDSALKVGAYDYESDTWPIYQYVGRKECYGAIAEFYGEKLAHWFVECIVKAQAALATREKEKGETK